MTTSAEELRQEVRRRYAESARSVTEGSGGCGCGSGSCCADDDASNFGEALYAAEQRGELPDAAVLASLGCGNPTAVADLHEGETVLDLGSGGGIDVILSAKRVGPTGLVYGLDMTDEMLALATRNADEAGVENAIFLKGMIEQVPLPAESVDVVISNCVINLSIDKAAVLTEMARVLKPGGRVGVSDIVAEDRLTSGERAERGSYVGCVAGALSRSEYHEGLRAAGFDDVEVTFTHEVADGIHGAIIKAVRATTAPIACSLNAEDRSARYDAWAKLLRLAASRDEITGGVRYSFAAANGIEDRVRHLAAAEKECCSFYEFDVSAAGDRVELTILAPAEAQEHLHRLFGAKPAAQAGCC